MRRFVPLIFAFCSGCVSWQIQPLVVPDSAVRSVAGEVRLTTRDHRQLFGTAAHFTADSVTIGTGEPVTGTTIALADALLFEEHLPDGGKTGQALLATAVFIAVLVAIAAPTVKNSIGGGY